MARADDTELIDSFEEFYRSYYRNEIAELAQKYPSEQKSLYIDWQDLYRYDADMADDFRNKPKQLREYAEEALRLYDLPVDVSLGQAHVRVRGLPETTDIRAIRADHRGMLLSIQGIVRKATDVRPKITTAAFECQRCGTLTRIPQEGDFQEPHECQGCERQGPFRINYDQSEFIDAQKLRVQESPEGLRGGETPQNIDVNIEDDITGEVTAGDHVAVTGILQLDQQGNDREKSAMFDIYMDGLTVEIEDEEFEEMDITDEDKKEIVELSNQPDIYEQMKGAIAPSIYGYEKEKMAMAFQLFSGVTKFLPDDSRTRGDLHMLLIGDPGTGKCVEGSTSVRLSDGSRQEIGDLVEQHLTDPVEIDDGYYDEVDINVPTLQPDGTISEGSATKVWKRDAPDEMYEIRTASGRELEVTPSHPLFVQANGTFVAREAEQLREGQLVATAYQDETPVTDGGAVLDTPPSGQRTLTDANVSWDRIESIQPVEPDYDWVYDLEIAETHNYISEGIVSHNSQLLQYVNNIAPRSVYTSGKGSSSAGLCVTGDTLIHTKEGYREIRDIVTEEIPDQVASETSAERTLPVYTFDRETNEIELAETSNVWRMPEKPCRRLETSYGKELEASRNTPVLTCGENGIEWVDITEITEGDYIAVPDYTESEASRSPVEVREFLELTTEKVKPTDDSIAFLRTELCETFGTLRDAASALSLPEDFVYDTLSNRHIPLEKLDTVLDGIDTSREEIAFERVMVRHGDSITVPETFDEELMYLLGLVFGDGDIRLDPRDGNRGCVRISNSDEALLERAIDIIAEKFDKDLEIEYQEDKVPCIRLHSATIARLFANAGMETPKSELQLHPKLTTAEHADAFLRGLMDADGAVSSRTNGGSSLVFSTISEKLARQVQRLLETYGVRAQRRERDRRGEYELDDGHVIESKHVQYFVEIYGADIDRYAEQIGFACADKQAQLQGIVGEDERREARIPVGKALASSGVSASEYKTNLSRGSHPGPERAKSMLDDLDLGAVEPLVSEAIDADLYWEEVVTATDTGEKEVFDVTVPETHNFVANGIVTHNTAAAVRDDFGDGQQWTLEAGALVLADRGIAAIDELDKMRCVTGDTLVHTTDGIMPIETIARRTARSGEIEQHESGRTIRDVDLDVWTMTDDNKIASRSVTAVHEYAAPDSLREVTLESGEAVTATADHPFFVLEDGRRVEKPVAELETGDWVYVPDSIPSSVTDGGTLTAPGTPDRSQEVTSDHGSILGYVCGDGNVYYKREEGSYGIRFTNAEEELLEDFERACRDAFDDGQPARYPSEQRDDGVGTVRLHGRKYVDELLDCGLNIETYDGKRVPEAVTKGSHETKAAFIRALADSEATVGERNVKIHSSSYELLLGTKMLLLEFGVTSQIQTRTNENKRDLYILAITADESLAAFNRQIGFHLGRKQRALEEACEQTTGTRTILDVLPECDELFATARESLRLYQSECGIPDGTYCSFENGDANFSFDAAKRILSRFEQRKQVAIQDLQTLATPCSWETLAKIKDKYHVTQEEISEEIGYSQSQISSHWGETIKLREAIQGRLESIVTAVAETEINHLQSLVRADVKWRQVADIESATPSTTHGRRRVLCNRLGELLDCETDSAVEQAETLLSNQPAAEDWSALRKELERHSISFQQLATRFDVAGSTVSRWFSETVDGEDLEVVRTVAFDLIKSKRSRIRALLNDVTAISEPGVYDLTVDGTHNFIANGMVVHNSEDQSAMHEALEQQSYHPETEILLADGRRVEIGEFVDERMAATDDVIDGVDCEILPTEDIGVHTVDTVERRTEKTAVDRVSRHEAPSEFVRVTLSNGRDVLVTPEHPMFVDDDGEIGTVEAQNIEEGAFVPAPRKLPNSAQPVELTDEPQVGKEKDVDLPETMSPALGEILGFLVAEGHSYAGSSHEIGFSNQDERLLDRMESLMSSVFCMTSSETTNEAGTVTKRWTSTKLYRWFETNFPEVMETAREKRIPAAVLGASEEVIRRFLVGAFQGDGGVESEAMSFSTASGGLAEDYADALSKIGVASRILHDDTEDAWKTYVMGDSTAQFVESVVTSEDDRYDDAKAFVERSNETPRHHDVLPTSATREIRSLRRLLGVRLTGSYRPHLDNNYGVQVESVEDEIAILRARIEEIAEKVETADSLGEVRSAIDWSGRQLAERLDGETSSAIHYAEDGGYDESRRKSLASRSRAAVQDALSEAKKRLAALEARTELRYYRVTDVETVPNEGEHACEWVYDVTVEPTNTFVSKGVVLHNSISVSKAGINATLKARCSLLGAANPTMGRFDRFEPIGEQIDLEPPLISRFDLIFTVTDDPDEEEDAELAEHILQTNYAGELNTHRTETSTSNYTKEEVERVTDEVAPTIEPELLRKYVAYAKRNCYPTMTEEAKGEIQDFYVQLRSRGADEDAPVPVTARKLEALVRLAEASARVRLSDDVEREDAQRAIDIAQYCLEEIGMDPETGELDADMIETGTSKSQRDRIKNIKHLIEDIEEEYDEGAPVDVIVERAEEEGIDPEKADHEIDKLKQKGEVYEPQNNHLRTT